MRKVKKIRLLKETLLFLEVEVWGGGGAISSGCQLHCTGSCKPPCDPRPWVEP